MKRLKFVRKLFFLVLICSLTFMLFFVENGDFVGILASVLFIIFPLVFPFFKNNRKLLLLIILGLCLRQALAFCNAYVYPIKGASEDALRFHLVASGELESPEEKSFISGIGLMIWMLTTLYELFGSSFLLAHQFNVIAFFLNCLLLWRIAKLVQAQNYLKYIFVFFLFLPSNCAWGVAPLREPWQAFAFMCLVLSIIELQKKLSIYHLLLLFLGVLGLFFFHSVFKLFLPFFLVVSIIWYFRVHRIVWNKTFLRILTLLGIPVIIVVFAKYIFPLIALYRRGALSDALKGGQSLYESAAFQTTNPILGLFFIPLYLFMYFFAPLPWQIRRPIDFLSLGENFVRLILLIGGVLFWKRTKQPHVKDRIFFIWISFLMLEGLWAMGTVSWFTAMRHHLPAYGLLAIIGSAGVIYIVRKITKLLFRK